jgi:hypothetical protein
MKRFHVTSKTLFKATVALLMLPGAVLVLIVAGLILFQRLVGNGIGSFSFAVKARDLQIAAAAALALVALLFVMGRWLLRRSRR